MFFVLIVVCNLKSCKFVIVTGAYLLLPKIVPVCLRRLMQNKSTIPALTIQYKIALIVIFLGIYRVLMLVFLRMCIFSFEVGF